MEVLGGGSGRSTMRAGAQRPMPELHAQGLSVAAEHGLPPLSPPSPPAMEQPWRANTSSNTSRGAPTGLFGHNGNPHGPRAGPSGVTARGYGSTAPISGSRATAAGHRSSGGVANPAAPSSLAHGRSGGSAGTSPGTQRATGRALARVVSGPRMGSVLGAGAGGAGARAVDAQRQQQQPPRWSASPRGGAPREDPAAGPRSAAARAAEARAAAAAAATSEEVGAAAAPGVLLRPSSSLRGTTVSGGGGGGGDYVPSLRPGRAPRRTSEDLPGPAAAPGHPTSPDAHDPHHLLNGRNSLSAAAPAPPHRPLSGGLVARPPSDAAAVARPPSGRHGDAATGAALGLGPLSIFGPLGGMGGGGGEMGHSGSRPEHVHPPAGPAAAAAVMGWRPEAVRTGAGQVGSGSRRLSDGYPGGQASGTRPGGASAAAGGGVSRRPSLHVAGSGPGGGGGAATGHGGSSPARAQGRRNAVRAVQTLGLYSDGGGSSGDDAGGGGGGGGGGVRHGVAAPPRRVFRVQVNPTAAEGTTFGPARPLVPRVAVAAAAAAGRSAGGGGGSAAAGNPVQRRQLNAGPSRPARGRGLADSDSSSDDGVVGSAGLRFGRAGPGPGAGPGGGVGGFQERFLADMRRREAEREQLAALLLPQGEDELLRQAEDAQLAMALMLSMQDAGLAPPALGNPPNHSNSSSGSANRGVHAASPAPRSHTHPHHPLLAPSHPLAAAMGLGLGPASGLTLGSPLALLGLGAGGGGSGGGGWAGGGPAAAAAATLLRGVEYGGYGEGGGAVGGLGSLGGLGGGLGVVSDDGGGGGGGALSYEALLQLEDVKVTTPQEVLDALPRSTFTGPRDGAESACAICQSDYAAGEQLVRLPCCHVLHWGCAEQWLGGYSRKCPVCKQGVCG